MSDQSSENLPKDTTGDAPADGAKAPRRRYGSGAAGKGKEPFAYKAARIAFWAPLVGIAIGLVATLMFQSAQSAGDVSMQRDISFYAGGSSLILMVLALVMGPVALLAIRKHGKPNLFTKSLTGMAIAAVILTLQGMKIAEAYSRRGQRGGSSTQQVVVPTVEQVEGMLAGNWKIEGKSGDQPVLILLTIRPDHTGSWKIEGPQKMDLSGKWMFEMREKVPVFSLSLEGPENKVVKVEGILRVLSDNELTLSNVLSDGRVANQTFVRVR